MAVLLGWFWTYYRLVKPTPLISNCKEQKKTILQNTWFVTTAVKEGRRNLLDVLPLENTTTYRNAILENIMDDRVVALLDCPPNQGGCDAEALVLQLHAAAL